METWSSTNGNSIFIGFVGLDRKTLTSFLFHYKSLWDLILCEQERSITDFVKMDRTPISLDLAWRIRHKGLWDLILHKHKQSFGMDRMTTSPRNYLTASLGMSSDFFGELLPSECLDFFPFRISLEFLHFFFFGSPQMAWLSSLFIELKRGLDVISHFYDLSII